MDYRRALTIFAIGATTALASTGCGGSAGLCAGVKNCTNLPTGSSEAKIKAAFDAAASGDTIAFAKGTYKLTAQLSIAVPGVTVLGAGRLLTTLDFTGSAGGQDGIHVETSGAFTIQGLTVQNANANGIKVLGADGVIMRDVGGVWTKNGDPTNGRYALYPVQCKNVLIDNSFAQGSSDAGIYVGQCQNVVVENSESHGNVAGLEIENTSGADVHDNVVHGNTAGLMVFGLPGLPGRHNTDHVRVYKNTSSDNNFANFAALGGIVAKVPAGFGALIMASSDVEFFANTIDMHDSVGIAVVSYCIADQGYCSLAPTDAGFDAAFDPFPRRVNIHDNTVTNSGTSVASHLFQDPGGDCTDSPPPTDPTMCSTPRVNLLAGVMNNTYGSMVPNIVYDGIFVPEGGAMMFPTGTDAKNPMPLCLQNNGTVTFSNFDANNFDDMTQNFPNAKLPANEDITTFTCTLDALPAITLGDGITP